MPTWLLVGEGVSQSVSLVRLCLGMRQLLVADTIRSKSS